MLARVFFAVLLLYAYEVEGVDDITMKFVRSFVVNEGKPTHLSLICWGESDTLQLAREVFSLGTRCSARPAPRDGSPHSLTLLDLDCPEAKDHIQHAAASGLLRSPFRWLVISSSQVNRLNNSFLWEAPILADSDLVLAERTEEGFNLTELHKPYPGGPTQSTIRGYFSASLDILKDVRPHRELFWRRRDIMGHVITISNVIESNTTIQTLPIEDRATHAKYDTMTKTCYSNMIIACQMLNASARPIFTRSFGYFMNGKWMGTVDHIITGRAEMGTNCNIRADRQKFLLFLDVLSPYRVKFVLRQPPLSLVSNIFALPFSWSVWAALLVCCALAVVGILAATRHEARCFTSVSSLDGGLGDALLLTVAAISQQGCSLEPKKASGRILVFILFTSLMAIYAAYSANIVVLLQAPSNYISSLEDLANSKITLAALDVDYNRYSMKLANSNPVHREIYKRISPDKGQQYFYPLEEGVERVRQGVFAFHAITESLYRRIEQTFTEMEKCDLVEVEYLHEYIGLPFRRDSPYVEHFRVAFKRIREAGIRSAIIRWYQVPMPRCSGGGTAFSSAGLREMRGVLALWLIGAGAALVVLAAERAAWKVAVRRSRRTN